MVIFNKGILICNTISLLLILVYAFFLYKYDRPNGEYINSLMTGLYVFQVIGFVDVIFQLTGGAEFSINQYILLLNLFYFLSVMLRKLRYTYSPFGEFYERIIFSNKNLFDLKIKRIYKSQ